MSVEENIVINDLVYFKDIKIVQNKKYFNFSLDSVLLPNFVKLNKRINNILDLCTGNAPIPLILSTKTKAKIYGVELQKEIFDLATQTININKLDGQIELINEDAKDTYNRFNSDTFDIITCNPPYFKVNRDSIKNDNEIKSVARHEISINLEDILKISRKLLKNNGQLALVHRTDRLIDIIYMMRVNNIEPKRIRFVYPKDGEKSNLVLISGNKNGNPGLEIIAPLIIHNDDGTYSEEVIKMFS